MVDTLQGFQDQLDEVRTLLRLPLTPEMINAGTASELFPRRTRLSDSAMGVAITIGITVQKSRECWPLNFNAAGFPIAEPRLANLGHPFILHGKY